MKAWDLKRSANYGSPRLNEHVVSVIRAEVLANPRTLRLASARVPVDQPPPELPPLGVTPWTLGHRCLPSVDGILADLAPEAEQVTADNAADRQQ